MSDRTDMDQGTQTLSVKSPPAISHHLLIRAGQTGATVGLLPGLCPASVGEANVVAVKKVRAPRKDMANLSAEARIQWRKGRARCYSTISRERSKAQFDVVQQEVQGLRIFRAVVEEAPHIVLVLSDDIRCRILYASTALFRLLHINVASVLGEPFLQLLHADERVQFVRVLSAIILTRSEKPQRVGLRVKIAHIGQYLRFDARLRHGTQGIHCTLWPSSK